jgi:hypothetical protein
MKIMFEDLTYEAQMRLLDEAGVESPNEMRWHIMPVAVVDFDKEGRTRHEDNFADDLSDCDPGGPCY